MSQPLALTGRSSGAPPTSTVLCTTRRPAGRMPLNAKEMPETCRKPPWGWGHCPTDASIACRSIDPVTPSTTVSSEGGRRFKTSPSVMGPRGTVVRESRIARADAGRRATSAPLHARQAARQASHTTLARGHSRIPSEDGEASKSQAVTAGRRRGDRGGAHCTGGGRDALPWALARFAAAAPPSTRVRWASAAAWPSRTRVATVASWAKCVVTSMRLHSMRARRACCGTHAASSDAVRS